MAGPLRHSYTGHDWTPRDALNAALHTRTYTKTVSLQALPRLFKTALDHDSVPSNASFHQRTNHEYGNLSDPTLTRTRTIDSLIDRIHDHVHHCTSPSPSAHDYSLSPSPSTWSSESTPPPGHVVVPSYSSAPAPASADQSPSPHPPNDPDASSHAASYYLSS